MIRRIGKVVLIEFDYLKQAKAFFIFMRKRNKDGTFIDGV